MFQAAGAVTGRHRRVGERAVAHVAHDPGRQRRQGAKSAPPPAIKVRRTRLGAVLTDARSRTLYLFNEDKHGRSTCHGACAMVWPPAPASGTPHAGHRVVAGS
jgi:predicted lipoprotein with Yx(FWY)xxD motif